MRLLLRSAFVLCLLGTASGCGGVTIIRSPPRHVRSEGLVYVPGAYVEPRPRRGSTNVYVGRAENVYINGNAAEPAVKVDPPPASPRDAVSIDERKPFDPQGARRAVSAVDLAPCAPRGAPKIGHAKITFNPDGRVSKVVVDEPRGMSTDAAECVGEKLGTATVPEYKGSLVVMGTTWRLP